MDYYIFNDSLHKKVYINKDNIVYVTWIYREYDSYLLKIYVNNSEKPFEANYNRTNLNKKLKELGLPLLKEEE